LEKAALFVGGDSGPAHLAAASGTAVVGLLGPTSTIRFRPWGGHCRVASLSYPCSPDVVRTYRDRCWSCPFTEPRCLTELPVETVLDECHAALAQSALVLARH
jgi:ADP-heptose:LPS heptosyltransferase